MTILSCTSTYVLPLRRLLMRHRRLNSSNASSSTTTTSFSFSSLLSWYSKQLDRRPILTKIISSALIAASGDIICQVLDNNNNNNNNIKDDYSSDDIHDAATHTANKNEEQIVADTNKRTKDTIVASIISIVVDDDDKYNSAAIKTTNDTTTQQQMKFSIDWYRTGRFFLIGAFFVAPATHVWYGFLSTRLIPGKASPKRIVQRLCIDQFGAAPLFCNTFMGLLWLLEGKKSSVVRTELIEAAPKLIVSNWKLWIPAMGVMFNVVPLKFQVLYSNFVGLIWTVYLSYASTRLQKSSSPPFLEPTTTI